MNETTKKNSGFKKFLIIWVGELISSIGTGMTSFGLGVYVWQMTHSAVDVALVELVALLPMILLAPVAGVLADWFDRRLLMMIGDFASAFGLIFLLILLNMGNIQVWQICLCVGSSSIFVSLLDPAYKATITDLLTEDEYSKAVGMVSMASSSKFLISPIIGGFIMAVFGMETILMIDILTLFITIIAILVVRKTHVNKLKRKEKLDFFADFKEGWMILVESKGVMLLIFLVSFLCFYIGFIQILSKPMCLPLADEKIVGILQTICASGMLVSGIMIGSRSFKHKYVDVMVISFCVVGVGMIGFGATTNLAIIGIFGFIVFLGLPYSTTSIDILLRKTIENDKQGRAWGLISLISQLGYVVAFILSGILSDYLFIPALQEGGILANNVGMIIGIGETRGIGLLIILAGIGLIFTALGVSRSKTIRAMES